MSFNIAYSSYMKKFQLILETVDMDHHYNELIQKNDIKNLSSLVEIYATKKGYDTIAYIMLRNLLKIFINLEKKIQEYGSL